MWPFNRPDVFIVGVEDDAEPTVFPVGFAKYMARMFVVDQSVPAGVNLIDFDRESTEDDRRRGAELDTIAEKYHKEA